MSEIVERPALGRTAWIGLIIALPVLGVGYQFCAEQLARAMEGRAVDAAWIVRLAQQIWLPLLVVFEIGSFAAWMIVLSRVPVSAAFPLTAASYGLVLTLGWVVFREPVLPLQVAGAFAIGAGVLVLTGGGRSLDKAGQHADRAAPLPINHPTTSIGDQR